MWKVFPKIALIKVMLSIFAALFLVGLILIIGPTQNDGIAWDDFGSAFKLATPVTLIFIGIIFFIGKWGWLILWKAPFLGKVMHTSVCPNLNGKWLGKIQSSFKNLDGTNTIKEVELTIKANLFELDISLNSTDGYQDSKVIQSELYKDPRTNVFYLLYIFESSVPIPMKTDVSVFEGAAKLEIAVSAVHTEMKGTYWTNRAWQKGENTAGAITVSRVNT